MSDILESILSATESKGFVVSENHDINQINVGGDSSDPTGIKRQIENIRKGNWDAAEYGISAEAQIAKLEAANTPEAREKAMAELRQRAINRAGLDTSNGRVNVMVAGEAAWYKLGVNVSEAQISKEAINHSGLGWKVKKTLLRYMHGDDVREASEVFALIREDTGEMLSAVGPIYEPIQNEEAFAFLDEVLKIWGAKYETAGSLYGGKKVWMQAIFPQQSFELPGGDENKAYVMFSNPHVQGQSAYVIPTNDRVVCANTHRIAMSKDRDKGLCIRHTGNVRDKVNKCKEILGITMQGFQEFKETAEVMVRKELKVKPYAGHLLDAVLGITDTEKQLKTLRMNPLEAVLQIEETEKRLEKLSEKKEDLLEEILKAYDSPTNTAKGSAWAAYNSVSEIVDHSRLWGPRRGEHLADRRLEYVMNGEGDTVKQLAFAMASKT